MTRTKNPEHNFSLLCANPYPGRGIVAGIDESGRYFVQLYWIMGRSENSRNRIFTYGDGSLKTAAADPAKVKDASLIMYNAMRERGGRYIVSNGDQTDTVYDGIRSGNGFRGSLEHRDYEPDKPNYTPRITAITSIVPVSALFSIIRKHDTSGASVRDFYAYERKDLTDGVGLCVTTYEGDGDPLPAFCGGPYQVPLRGTGDEILRTYWNALNTKNRVAIALKLIELRSGISSISAINRYEAVAA